MLYIIIEFVEKRLFKNVIHLAPITPLNDDEDDLEGSFRSRSFRTQSSSSSESSNTTMKSSYEELYKLV